MPKLLIVDDEAGIRQILRKYAEFEGYEVTEAENGLDAVEKFQHEDFDLIILDVMMPEIDGFTALKKIRETSDIPILMLTAKGEEYDKVLGFELGVDDYVVKPFSAKEIMLRINAILRRGIAKQEVGADGFFACKESYVVRVDQKRVELSPKLYELLFYLMDNAGRVLSREQILTAVWGYDFFGDDRTLDTHVKLLRQKIAPYDKRVRTIRGVGYKWE